MLEYNSEIYSILSSRVNSQLLEGYYGGDFGPLKDRFWAITYVPVASIDYDNFEYSHSKLGGCLIYFVDEERKRKYLDANTYQHKSTKECIDERIYRAFSIRFLGLLFENTWYIEPSLTFIGDKEDETKAKEQLEAFYFNADLWESDHFRTIKELEPTQIPDDQIVRDIELVEFSNMPWFVANIKREKKTSLKRAFSTYMHELVFQPFIEKLRIHFPDKFKELLSLYSEEFTLLYPASKEYILLISLAENKASEFKITYFLYMPSNERFYHWIFPKERITSHSYHYAMEIIDDIKDISGWDDCQYLVSSCTLDNSDFWNGYVLKKNNEDYIYLKEIKFPD